MSHHDSKPFVNNTTLTRDWTANRKQLKHGFHSDCHTMHVHKLKMSLPAYPEIQPALLWQSTMSLLGKSQVLFCMATHGMQLQNPPTIQCCSTVPDSDRPQRASSSSGIDRLCTLNSGHLFHLWNLHCLTLSAPDIHERSDQPYHSYGKHLSSWRHHPWVLCFFLGLSCLSCLSHSLCWFDTNSPSRRVLSSRTRDRQHPSRVCSDPLALDLTKSFSRFQKQVFTQRGI